MMFMGRLGKEVLAGGSLAIGFANITGYSVLSGLSMGMEAISSQAFGAKQWHLISQSLQRTITILLFICIPISLLWLNVQPILVHSGQNPFITSIASIYLIFSLPDLLFQAILNPLKIYLRSQNITQPLMHSTLFALIFHAPINYILVYHLKLGIRGVAIAGSLTNLNLLLALLVYLYFSQAHKNSWQSWSMECFREWKPILKLAIPSCVSVCLEWWWYELMIVFAGLLSTNATESVATMGILIQTTSLIYIFPSSMSQAVSTRVGNELGANRPDRARTSSHIAVVSAVLTGIVAMIFAMTVRNLWGRAFTTDDAIISMTAMALPVVGLCELGNCPQTTGCGVLRGSARPSLGAHINLASFYGVGLPVALIMGFTFHLGLLGLWMGLLAAQVTCAAVMAFILSKTDWTEEARRAKELTGANMEASTRAQPNKTPFLEACEGI
ncbi:Detoxification-like protein [Thalictrum thalictroides]|uniref:Detoxification-like protein n=1 Tax=Thalictrum thalictroides TaxID=46969 RepID=A0A7J6WSR8_THATH|nr:Detoxification-like protein [Thalictrum thalictroides]